MVTTEYSTYVTMPALFHPYVLAGRPGFTLSLRMTCAFQHSAPMVSEHVLDMWHASSLATNASGGLVIFNQAWQNTTGLCWGRGWKKGRGCQEQEKGHKLHRESKSPIPLPSPAITRGWDGQEYQLPWNRNEKLWPATCSSNAKWHKHIS